MYLGSVRFFKHVILGTVALMIIIPTAFAVYFGVSYYQLTGEYAKLEEKEADEAGAFDELLTAYAADGADEKDEKLSKGILPYQNSYPDLYVENSFEYAAVQDKTVYLTFDDGPTALTPKVLDVLKEHNVRATFFIVYKGDEGSKALYRRMVAEGHTLAVHSTTHQYKKIYQSVESFLDDFVKTAELIEDTTGKAPELFRFPGGSINSYNTGIYEQLIAEMSRRGYTYYDWNVASGDTTKGKTKASIYTDVVNGVRSTRQSIVLMHDHAGNDSTLQALPEIIKTLKGEGYAFAPLDKTVQPVMFGYAH